MCWYVDWDLAAKIATAIGLPLGALTALVAVLSYRGQLEGAADAHMHSLFRGYLEVVLRGDGGNALGLETFKLYTFEEMYDWVVERRQAVEAWGWLLGPASVKRRHKELDAWEETVRSHLLDGIESAYERVRGNTSYGCDFRKFVKKTYDDEMERRPKKPPAP